MSLTTPEAFGEWAGIGTSLTPVQTPVGDAWILVQDEATTGAAAAPAPPAPLLSSCDAFILLSFATEPIASSWSPTPTAVLPCEPRCLARRPPCRGRDHRDQAARTR